MSWRDAQPDLPEGWVWTTVGAVADVDLGKMLDRKKQTGEHTMQYLRNINVRWHALNLDGLLTMDVSPETRSRYTVRTGDLVVCEGGEPGRCAVVTEQADGLAFQKALHRLRPAEGVDVGYLAYAFDAMAALGHLAEHLTGSTIKHLPKERLLDLPLPLPPTEEQRLIARELSGLLPDLQRAREAARLLAARVRLLQNSVLSSTLHADLQTVPLADLVERVEAGKSFECLARPAEDDEWGVVKVSAMTWGEFRAEENKALPPGRVPQPESEIHEGDILISRANTETYVGAPVLVGPVRDRLLLSDKSLRLIPSPGVDPKWLVNVLRSPAIRRQVSELATGTKESMRNISQRKLLTVWVPAAPSALEQSATAAYLEELRAGLSGLATGLLETDTLAEALRRTILRHAFAGRLVPPVSGAEPAEILLKRIDAERIEPQTKRTARTRTRSPLRPVEPEESLE